MTTATSTASSHQNVRYWASGALLLNALIWGLSWLPLRYLDAYGVHAIWSTTAFSLFAVIWVVFTQRLHLSEFIQHRYLYLLVVASGLTNVCFNWGVTIGDVTRVVLLFYLMPAWANILAWVFLRERLSFSALLQLLLSLIGVILVLTPETKGLPVPSSLADWLGLAGGFCFALTNVMLRKLRVVRESSRMLAMFGGGLLISVIALGAGLMNFSITPLPAFAWHWAAVLFALCVFILIGNLCLQYGTSHLLIKTVALLMLAEVVVATVSSSFAGASQLTLPVILGGLLIAGAALWSILISH